MGVKELSDKVKSAMHRVTHPDGKTVMEGWKQWLTGTKAELYGFHNGTKKEGKEYEDLLGYGLAEGTLVGTFTGSAYLAQKYPAANSLVAATLLWFCVDTAGKMAMTPQSAIGVLREALGKGKKWSDLEKEWIEEARQKKHDELMETYELFDEAYLSFFEASVYGLLQSGAAREDLRQEVESVRNGVLVRAREYLGMKLAEDVPDTPLSEVVPVDEYVHWTMRASEGYSLSWWSRASQIEYSHDLVMLAMKEGMERFTALKGELETYHYESVGTDDTEQPEDLGEEGKGNGD